MAPGAPLVKPFRALRYDVDAVGPLDELVAPPFDVIGLDALRSLAERNPHNVIRLIRPRQPELAAERLRVWSREGVLVREERPAVWRIEEEFVGPDGVARTRRGIAARVRLEPYASGLVLPHERVFSGQAEARLRLIRATRTKLSPLLLLHGGPAVAAAGRAPDLEATLEGTTTRLWRVDDVPAAGATLETLRPPFVIADGHHRYDAALRYHGEEGTAESGYVLAVFVSGEDAGLTIFPTHRLVSGPVPVLNGDYRISALDGAGPGLERLSQLPRDHPAFVLVRPGEAMLAEQLRPGNDPVDRLDVAALDRLQLQGVTFTPSSRDAEDAVASGKARAAFLVRAPTIAEVEAIARAGRTMPEKSTYFFPKLVSGLLMSPFDE